MGVHVGTFMRDHVLVCLFTAVDERARTQAVIVCMCESAYKSRQGVLNQFWLNGERHVALLSMSVQRPFIVGLFQKPKIPSAKWT